MNFDEITMWGSFLNPNEIRQQKHVSRCARDERAMQFILSTSRRTRSEMSEFEFELNRLIHPIHKNYPAKSLTIIEEEEADGEFACK